MTDMRICGAVAIQASPSLEIYNAVYVPWDNMHCVQLCVSDVQSEGNFSIQLSE